MNLVSPSKKINNEFLVQFIINAKYRLYRHLILIVFIGATFYNGKDIFTEPANTYSKIAFFSLLLFLFYLNMYWLIPKLLFKDRYLEYFLWVLILFGVAFILLITTKHFVRSYVRPLYKEEVQNTNILVFSFLFVILMAASSAVKFFQRWILDSQRIAELESITMHAELEQLKKQINPHFLFNTLNNANVLIQKDAETASQVLMKLSDLLRYQLYDSARNKVLLTAEIHFLEDFLSLEKIRRDDFEFTVFKAGDLNGIQVVPLLFIIFVENAVKHNMDAEKHSYIDLFFNMEDNQLYFRCVNSKPEVEMVNNDKGGLGLSNVKRRLELLYPGKYSLDIRNERNTFSLYLAIKL
ncbi:MAG TPA: histidine kinase [Mucilaginibacter sp.]